MLQRIRICVTAQIKPAPTQRLFRFSPGHFSFLDNYEVAQVLQGGAQRLAHCCLGSSQGCLGKLQRPGRCSRGVPSNRCAAPKPRALPPNGGRDPPPSGCLLFGPCRKAGARLVAWCRLAWGGGQQCAGSIATPQQDPGPRPPGTQFTILNARARVQGGTRAATGPFWPEYPEARLRCQAVGPQEETWTPMPTFAWSQRKSTIFKGMRWER